MSMVSLTLFFGNEEALLDWTNEEFNLRGEMQDYGVRPYDALDDRKVHSKNKYTIDSRRNGSRYLAIEKVTTTKVILEP